jgi:Holliday junction resolvase-like predicted endonuclease
MSVHLLFLVLVAFVMTLLLGGWLFFKWNRFLEKRNMKKIKRQGDDGEKKAKQYLLKHGYEILLEQAKEQGVMWVDGEEIVYDVRADFLVKKNGIRSVVEVKTGRVAIKPNSINTRRQLLEYSLVYDVDSLLFFDAENNNIMDIQFPKNSSILKWIRPFLLGVLAGGIIVLIILFFITFCK